jgi:hypothetical protein
MSARIFSVVGKIFSEAASIFHGSETVVFGMLKIFSVIEAIYFVVEKTFSATEGIFSVIEKTVGEAPPTAIFTGTNELK